jgi:hypothetical protein
VAAGLARHIEQLCDIGEGRIANMDTAGLDLQVLSLTAPGVEQLDAVEAVALVVSGIGYLLLSSALAPAAFVSGPLLPIWVSAVGISLGDFKRGSEGIHMARVEVVGNQLRVQIEGMDKLWEPQEPPRDSADARHRCRG